MFLYTDCLTCVISYTKIDEGKLYNFRKLAYSNRKAGVAVIFLYNHVSVPAKTKHNNIYD